MREISENIAARTRSDRVLKASETRYRRLFETAKDGILILDAGSGQIVDVNPFLMELTGYSREEFLGKRLWDIGPFKDVAASKTSFARLQDLAYVRYEDLPLETRDGRKIDVEFVSNLYFADGQPVIQCNVRDITERKRGEDEREKLEAQLRMSQKMEAIGSLAGGIAHDFNNLLCVILGYTGFGIDAAPEGDPQRDNFLQIRTAAERAMDLTHQLLAFGRRQVLQPVPLDLNKTVVGIEKMLCRILGEDVQFVTRLEPALGLIQADRGQIDQVIMNLVINAREAMPQGGTLTVSTSNAELDARHASRHLAARPGSYVRLSVTDTGCGMDEKTQARLFEPFFTTKGTGDGTGTGLGLSTVYGIVEQSGGIVWVDSAPGCGTTFEICFPRDRAAVAEAVERAPLSAARLAGTETILVVEDEDALREVARRVLGSCGYTVLTAAGGDEAQKICAAHAGGIDLLLTDVIMPRMSGGEVAKAISKMRPGIRVVFMSGYTDDAIGRHGVLRRGTHFLAKPFSADDLSRKIRDVLDEAVSLSN